MVSVCGAIEGVEFEPQLPPQEIPIPEEEPIQPEALLPQFLPAYTTWLKREEKSPQKRLLLFVGNKFNLTGIYSKNFFSANSFAKTYQDFSRLISGNLKTDLQFTPGSTVVNTNFTGDYQSREIDDNTRSLYDVGLSNKSFTLLSSSLGIYTSLRLNLAARKGTDYYSALITGDGSVSVKWKTSNRTRLKAELGFSRERLTEKVADSQANWRELRLKTAFCFCPKTHYLELGVGRNSNSYRALWYPYFRLLIRTPYLGLELSSEGKFQNAYHTFTTLGPHYRFPQIWEAGRTSTAIKTKIITKKTSIGKIEGVAEYLPLDNGFTFASTNDIPEITTGVRKKLSLSLMHYLSNSYLENKAGLQFRHDIDENSYQTLYIPRWEFSDSMAIHYHRFTFALSGNYISRNYLSSYFLLNTELKLQLGNIAVGLVIENVANEKFLWYPERRDYGRRWYLQMEYE